MCPARFETIREKMATERIDGRHLSKPVSDSGDEFLVAGGDGEAVYAGVDVIGVQDVAGCDVGFKVFQEIEYSDVGIDNGIGGIV